MDVLTVLQHMIIVFEKEIGDNRPGQSCDERKYTVYGIDSLISISIFWIREVEKLKQRYPYYSQELIFKHKIPEIYWSIYNFRYVYIQFLSEWLILLCGSILLYLFWFSPLKIRFEYQISNF